MTREELFKQLKVLADEAALSLETRPAAGVMYSLLGTLVTDEAAVICLSRHTSDFSRAEIRDLTAGRN